MWITSDHMALVRAYWYMCEHCGICSRQTEQGAAAETAPVKRGRDERRHQATKGRVACHGFDKWIIFDEGITCFHMALAVSREGVLVSYVRIPAVSAERTGRQAIGIAHSPYSIKLHIGPCVAAARSVRRSFRSVFCIFRLLLLWSSYYVCAPFNSQTGV